MYKYFLLLVNIFSLFFFFSSDVEITVEAPLTADPGSEFMVTVTISKGDINNFARYTQDLPLGLTAVEDFSAGGSFDFLNQKIKIIWMDGAMPHDETFRISYKVKVDPTYKGVLSLGGQFDYVGSNNERQRAVVKKEELVGVGDVVVDRGNNPASEPATGSKYTKRKYLDKDGNIIVEITINKGDENGFGKVVEVVPDGYDAGVIESHNGIFTFKNNEVKYLWQTLPAENVYIVSYRLIPLSKDIDKTKLTTNGKMSYLDNEGISREEDIVERPEDLAAYLKSLGGDEPPDKTPGDKIPTPDKGVKYRVQIFALKNYRPVSYFKKPKFKINEKIDPETDNGWHKYLVGKFDQYKGAKDYRVKIWNTTPMTDAFVCAYNNAARITVQEALMITNEPWVK